MAEPVFSPEVGTGFFCSQMMDFQLTPAQVYTAAAPKLSVRQTAEPSPSSADSNSGDASDASTSHTRGDAGSSLPSTANGETTPQASRHASASDIQTPHLEDDADAQLSPRQPMRSSSSPLPSTTPLAPGIHRAIRDSIDSHMNGEDSPVMNETLSVIDEHITDLNTPRHSFITPEPKAMTDSGSEYSTHVDNRLSYIHGHETDEEEENQPTEEQIRNWDHVETARQLRNLGVEPKHCDIFEEQEITGDVLLDMDQEFIFMKEFDFGVMGKRLKTWHKIKAFQEEVKGLRQPRGSVSSYSGREGSPEEFERSMSRAGHTGSFLPRIPSLSERPSTSYHHPRPSTTSSGQHTRFGHASLRSNPSTSLSHSLSQGREQPSRPSAASIRDINHSRRHSSVDTTTRSPGSGDKSSPAGHQKEPSFDRGWTMSIGAQALSSRPGTALGAAGEGSPRQTSESPVANDFGSMGNLAAHFDELDRGYFSGGEVESRRRSRRFLQKRDSTMGSVGHSRQSSYAEDQPKKSPTNKRHSRFGSADSIRDMIPHVSAAAKAYNGSIKGRFRSVSIRSSDKPGQQEGKSSTGPLSFSPFAPLAGKTDTDSSGRSSPLHLQQIKTVGPKFRRAVGLRTTSDATINNEKGSDTSPASASPLKESHPPTARTGSTTPSATSKSSERHSTDGSGKTADGGIYAHRPKMSVKIGTKSKKDTSAYTQGLEKKTPQEQMVGCDYCGWMKKKSSNLMTTWKPRLFVLRGRRLSYYYSEDDTEERGLIDITAHRVLRADQDPITALHATITGAKVSPTSPANSSSLELASSDQASSDVTSRSKTDSDSPFIFKLVPPKSGYSRTVQFTKPAIHYFQVDNVKQGRLWMAALMKATIERDLNVPVETTNKQKTISLKQARLLNRRPPELLAAPDKDGVDSSSKDGDNGLKIKGLSLDKTSSGDDRTDENSMLGKLGGIDTGPPSLLPESLAGPTT